ncbi:MAG TPA: universal stress protein [Solirubrobacteraceae bacterium]|nr:universal stress protein [Solirubrobacteraceae bacterium]
MGDPILVGYDGGDGARSALAEAMRLAGDVGSGVVAAYAYAPARIGGEVADLARALREAGEEVLEHARHQAEAEGQQIDTVLIDERPAVGLVAAADELQARMIVIGSNGESALRGAILGSTPYKLLSMTDRPVLVVRA